MTTNDNNTPRTLVLQLWYAAPTLWQYLDDFEALRPALDIADEYGVAEAVRHLDVWGSDEFYARNEVPGA